MKKVAKNATPAATVNAKNPPRILKFMHCPFCAHTDTSVLESRATQDGSSLRRRRECPKCRNRFTTYERVEGQILYCIKKDGRREPFDREKLRNGILKAIHKRPVSIEQVDQIVQEIEKDLIKSKISEIDTKKIGKAVLSRLKKLDQVAWLRFASVYLEFADLSDFESAIHKS